MNWSEVVVVIDRFVLFVLKGKLSIGLSESQGGEPPQPIVTESYNDVREALWAQHTATHGAVLRRLRERRAREEGPHVDHTMPTWSGSSVSNVVRSGTGAEGSDSTHTEHVTGMSAEVAELKVLMEEPGWLFAMVAFVREELKPELSKL